MNMKNIENLFVAISFGLGTNKDFEIYLNWNKSNLYKPKIFDKIKTYLIENFYPRLNKIYKEKLDANIYNKILEFLKKTNENQQDEIIKLLIQVDKNKKVENKTKLLQYFQNSLGNGNYELINGKILFYLFLINKFQSQQKKSYVEFEIFEEMGVQYNKSIEEHLKEIANYFNTNEYKLPEIEIFNDNSKNNYLILYFINLVNYFDKQINEEQLKFDLQQIALSNSVIEKFNPETIKYIIEKIEKHLEQHTFKKAKFYEDIFEGLLPESLWKNNLNHEHIKQEHKDIIIWIMKHVSDNSIKISEFTNGIKINLIPILKILLEKDLQLIVAYCLLFLMYDSIGSGEICNKYKEIIQSLNITPNIIKNIEGNQLVYSIFVFWLFSKEKEEQNEINKISKIQINRETVYNKILQNTIHIHCIFLYLNNSIRNMLLNKDVICQTDLVSIISDIHLNKKEYINPSSYLSKEDLHKDNINYLNSKGQENIVVIIKIGDEKVNNVYEQITQKIKSIFSSPEILYIECSQIIDTSIISDKLSIILNNKYYQLNGLIIEDHQHIKDILLITKYTYRFYSLFTKKFLSSIEIKYDKLYLVYFKCISKELNGDKHKQFIDKLELKKTGIYGKVLNKIKDIVPKIKEYVIIFNNGMIEFEVVNNIEIKICNKNNINTECQLDDIKIATEIRNLISGPEKLPIQKQARNQSRNNFNDKDNNSNILKKFESTLQSEYVYIDQIELEVKNYLKQISNEHSNIKANVKLVFYVSLLLFFKNIYVDEKLFSFLINEKMKITKSLLNKLIKLKNLVNENKCFDIEYLDNKISSPITESDKYFSFIIRYIIVIYRIKANTERYLSKEDILNKIRKLNEYKTLVPQEIYKDYIDKLNLYLDNNHKKIDDETFFKCQNIIFLNNETETQHRVTTQSTQTNEEKSKILQINKDINLICDSSGNYRYNSELLFYILYMLVYQYAKEKTEKMIDKLLINDKLQITKSKLNKLKLLQGKVNLNNNIDLFSLKSKLEICTNKTANKYAFFFNDLILIDYFERTNSEELDLNKILTMISELINFIVLHNNLQLETNLSELMNYLYEQGKKRIIDQIQAYLNAFFKKFNTKNIDENNKEESKRVLSFILFHWNQNKYLNTLIKNNINNIKPIFELFCYFNKETEIADILIFTLKQFNENSLHNELNFMYKQLKKVLKVQFYKETNKSNSYLQYVTILLFYYHKSYKHGKLISQTQAINLTNSDLDNLFDVYLVYSYMNSEIRKMVLSHKSGIAEDLINIFNEVQISQQKHSAMKLVNDMKNWDHSENYAFFDFLLAQKNVIQEVSFSNISSITSKELDKLPYLLFVEFEIQQLTEKSIESFKYLPNNQEKKLELMGAIIFNGNIKKIISRICFIYDKISRYWYSINQNNWQGSLLDSLKNKECRRIQLIYSRKVNLTTDKDIDVNKLSLINEKKGKSKYESIYNFSVNWFQEHNKKITSINKATFQLFSEIQLQFEYKKTQIQTKSPNCQIC